MRIRATLSYMASSEILNMIQPDVLKNIKTRDPKPVLRAYVIGHEGEARGNLIGVGNIVKKWFKSAIEKLYNKITVGTQLFNGHVFDSNDTAGRIPIGEVVGKSLRNVKDKLSTIVACWVYPDYRNLPLDVASMEAEIDLQGNQKEDLYVADVNEITGIALGNSALESPGFPGATLLGQIQAFAEKHKITLFEGDDMTLNELKQMIQEGKFQPSDLFGKDALFADPFISERVKEHNAQGYDKRRSEELTKEIEKLNKKIQEAESVAAEKDEAIKSLRISSAKSKIAPLFEKQITERKFDDRQTRFIKKNLDKFDLTDPEKIEKEFNSFLDGQVDEYKEVTKVLGIEIDEKTETTPGGEPDTKSPPTETDKHLNPEFNPMIKLT